METNEFTLSASTPHPWRMGTEGHFNSHTHPGGRGRSLRTNCRDAETPLHFAFAHEEAGKYWEMTVHFHRIYQVLTPVAL